MYPQPPLNIQGRCPICRGAVNFWNFHPWILDHCFLFENLHYTLSDLLDGLVRWDYVSYELPNLAFSYAHIWSRQATCLNLLVCCVDFLTKVTWNCSQYNKEELLNTWIDKNKILVYLIWLKNMYETENTGHTFSKTRPSMNPWTSKGR